MTMEALISNDTFYYLSEGEEPLDEENFAEALRYKALFPQGFAVRRLSTPAPTGKIWAEIKPAGDDSWYDLEEKTPALRRLRLKRIDSSAVRVWLFDTRTGERIDYGIAAVETDKKGEPFQYRNGSRHYMSRFQECQPISST